jgi:hypothetical protein
MMLEERRLLTPGIYVENFENDPVNPTGPVDPSTAVGGFDAAGDFLHTFSPVVVDQFQRTTGQTTPSAMPSQPFDLFLEGTDTVTFPHVNVAGGEAVNLASVLVGPTIAQSTVKFIGASDTLTRVFTFGNTWSKVTAGSGDLGDAGRALGAISSVFLDGFDGGEFADLSIFVQGPGVTEQPIPSGPTVDTPPNTPIQLTTFDLSENDDANRLTISQVALGVTHNGTFIATAGTVVNDGHSVTYTPPAQFHGVDYFGYTLEVDGNAASGEVKVIVDTPPEAGPIAYDFPHGTSGALTVPSQDFAGLLAYTQDADHDPLTIVPQTEQTSLGGIVMIRADGSFSYTPPLGVILDPVTGDTFTYKANDGLLDSNPGTVNIRVQDTAPQAGPVSSSGVIVADYHFDHVPFGDPVVSHGSIVFGPLPGSDPENDHLTYILVTPPAYGGLTLNPDGTFTYNAMAPAVGTLTPAPNPPTITNPEGSVTYATPPEDSFVYKVFDGALYSNDAKVQLSVADEQPSIPINFDLSADRDESVVRIPEPLVFRDTPNSSQSLFDSRISFNAEDSADSYSLLRYVVDGDDPVRLDLQAMVVSSLADIPPAGRNLIVADLLNDVLYIRIFDTHGRMVVNTDETQLPNPASQVDALKFQTSMLIQAYPDGQFGSNGDGVIGSVIALFDSPALSSLSFVIKSPPHDAVTGQPAGQIAIRPDGTYVYTPPPDLVATASHPKFETFTLAVTDGYEVSNTVTVFFTIASRTPLAGFDSDGDGVPDSDENGAGNQGDGNNDGIPDYLQANVTSLHDIYSPYVTLATDGPPLRVVKAIQDPHPSDSPSILSGSSISDDAFFPDGFFSFTVAVPLLRGSHTTVTMYLPADQPVPMSYYNYGPTPDDLNAHWYNFVYDGSTGAEIFPSPGRGVPTRIVLHFVDGQRGDNDLSTPGIIDVVGGPGPVSSPSVEFSDHNGNIVRLETDGAPLSRVAVTGNPSPSDSPPDSYFPYGFLHFDVVGLPLGGATTVTLYLPGAPPDAYYKYGPTPDDSNSHWYYFGYDGTTGAEIFPSGNPLISSRIVLHFVDGQRGDDDDAINGVIADPGAPAIRHFPTPAAGFVTSLYELVLGREPTSREIAHGTEQLASGLSRLRLAREVWNSPEHRGMEVARLYRAYLHRAPDPAGQAFWGRMLRRGAGETAVARRFFISREFRQANPTLMSFVGALEAVALGQPTDGSGSTTQRLMRLARQAGRAALVRDVLGSPAAAARLLTADDELFLLRPARPSEIRRASELLARRSSATAVIAERILASREFFEHIKAISASKYVNGTPTIKNSVTPVPTREPPVFQGAHRTTVTIKR